MNKWQLAKVSGLSYDGLAAIIKRLAIEGNRPELLKLDFSEDECIDIVRSARKTYKPSKFVLEKAEVAIHEWFVNQEREGFFIPGTADYVEAFAKKRPECCSTCVYVKRKTNDTVKKTYKPYCNLYRRWLNSGYDIYKDKCSCYVDDEDPKPKKWTRLGAPTNLDIHGEIDTTILGIERCNFTSDSKTEAINLLWQLQKG